MPDVTEALDNAINDLKKKQADTQAQLTINMTTRQRYPTNTDLYATYTKVITDLTARVKDYDDAINSLISQRNALSQGGTVPAPQGPASTSPATPAAPNTPSPPANLVIGTNPGTSATTVGATGSTGSTGSGTDIPGVSGPPQVIPPPLIPSQVIPPPGNSTGTVKTGTNTSNSDEGMWIFLGLMIFLLAIIGVSMYAAFGNSS